jgi:hypothetical protein
VPHYPDSSIGTFRFNDAIAAVPKELHDGRADQRIAAQHEYSFETLGTSAKDLMGTTQTATHQSQWHDEKIDF